MIKQDDFRDKLLAAAYSKKKAHCSLIFGITNESALKGLLFRVKAHPILQRVVVLFAGNHGLNRLGRGQFYL
ncbi:MAG: hypothetical protein ACI8UC_001916, partial [Psychromonas sp.]